MENFYAVMSIIAIYILYQIIATYQGKDNYRFPAPFWEIFLSLEYTTSVPVVLGSLFFYSYFEYVTMWYSQLN